jgi:hypothetical protein
MKGISRVESSWLSSAPTARLIPAWGSRPREQNAKHSKGLKARFINPQPNAETPLMIRKALEKQKAERPALIRVAADVSPL